MNADEPLKALVYMSYDLTAYRQPDFGVKHIPSPLRDFFFPFFRPGEGVGGYRYVFYTAQWTHIQALLWNKIII